MYGHRGAFDVPMDLETVHRAEMCLAQSLRINAVTIHPVYESGMFSADACALLIPYLKKENVAVNGTFEDARFVLPYCRLYC